LDKCNDTHIERDSSVAITRYTAEETEAVVCDTSVELATADDRNYDYYLLKATGEGVVELDKVDNYGSSIP